MRERWEKVIAIRRALVLLVVCGACSTPRTHRTGEPLVLPADPARGSCEETRWVQLAPTHVGAEAQETVAATQNWVMYKNHDESADGLAAYQKGLTLRLTSEQTARLIGNTQLRPDIDADVKAIHKKKSATNGFLIGGLVATGIGGGIALADLENPTAGLAIMSVGLVAELIALMIRPHNADVAWAGVRDRIFVDGETDVDALVRGVDLVNEKTRASCKL